MLIWNANPARLPREGKPCLVGPRKGRIGDWVTEGAVEGRWELRCNGRQSLSELWSRRGSGSVSIPLLPCSVIFWVLLAELS